MSKYHCRKSENSGDEWVNGTPRPIDMDALDALLISNPSRVRAAEYFNCSDTHIDNEIMRNFGLTFTQYKEIRLLDVVTRLKNVAINKALEGDVPALKYVLNNMSDWSDKQQVDLSNKGEPISVNLNYKKAKE